MYFDKCLRDRSGILTRSVKVIKIHLPTEDLKNQGPPPPISYNPNATTGKTPTEKLDSLKVDIKTQPGERHSETVAIYVLLFRTGSPEALLKFVTLLHNIIRGHDLSTGTQKFGMMWNLVVGESLQVFEQKAQEREKKTNKHKLRVGDEITHITLLYYQEDSAPEEVPPEGPV